MTLGILLLRYLDEKSWCYGLEKLTACTSQRDSNVNRDSLVPFFVGFALDGMTLVLIDEEKQVIDAYNELPYFCTCKRSNGKGGNVNRCMYDEIDPPDDTEEKPSLIALLKNWCSRG